MNALYYEVAVLCSFLYGTFYMYENWRGRAGPHFLKVQLPPWAGTVQVIRRTAAPSCGRKYQARMLFSR